ncbi:multiple sugar transport system permease protein [Kribbella sp. VKM Ac-2569]|uniref:carbohydrate ABC transporter permease n=1 Tax=Kribbella sp. VKM Ac-2569 TaxID=2512220 RepID=UPI00102AB21B|nr:carbohydrate ABC transporter permease [Kribbella sp. VKM Ac-2569]RZT20325.1 multiple sugar transport system permease protein [Kribbella sp. VKM Ac-2569]
MTTLQHTPTDRRRARRWLTHLALIAGTLVMVYPLLWMAGGSFKDEKDIFSQLNPFPSSLDPRNYIAGWTATDPTFTRFYINSLLIAVLAVAGNVIACTLTAYAFARLEFRGKKVFFGIMLGSIMLPAHALLIPQYVLFFNLGWVNTYLPLVVPNFLATDAFFIFLMVQFIRTIPRTLDEAAMIDGCGKVRIFSRIILPLTGPVLITTMIFTFIWTYNDFFAQLIYLSYPSSETVPVALRRFVDATGDSSYGQLLAMSVLSLVPTFIVFLLAQRRIVEGIATTGLKG